jgi:hypothetical protein
LSSFEKIKEDYDKNREETNTLIKELKHNLDLKDEEIKQVIVCPNRSGKTR